MPFTDRPGPDILAFARDVGRNAETRLRAAGAENVLHHLVVAIRRLDEELRLMLVVDALLQLPELPGAFLRLDGQIAVEGETLSVEPRSHHGKNDGRRPHERHHPQLLALGNGHHVRTGVCHGRTSRLGNHAHRPSLFQRLQIAGNVGRRRMLVQRIERHRVNVRLAVHLLQETARRTHILHNEMADAGNHFFVAGRQHPVYRRIAQGDGKEIKGWSHLVFRCSTIRQFDSSQ